MHPLKSLYIEKLFAIIMFSFMGTFFIFISLIIGYDLGFGYGNFLFLIIGISFLIMNIGWIRHYNDRKIGIQNAIEAGMYQNIDPDETEFRRLNN